MRIRTLLHTLLLQNPTQIPRPPPVASFHWNYAVYKEQTNEALEASANLTDEQTLMAELFDNKIEALGFSAVFAALSQGPSLLEFIQLNLLTNIAAYDAGISVCLENSATTRCTRLAPGITPESDMRLAPTWTSLEKIAVRVGFGWACIFSLQ